MRFGILLMLSAAVGLSVAGGGQGQQGPPPGWTALEWESLPQNEQEAVLFEEQQISDAAAGLIVPDEAGMDADLDQLEATTSEGVSLPGGMEESHESPIPRAWVISNMWRDYTPDRTRLVQVYAGQDAQTGKNVVVVNSVPADPADRTDALLGDIREYELPEVAGGVRIDRVDYPRFFLETLPPGLSFDVETREFNRSPDCSTAVASPDLISGNDHLLRSVTVSGATDVDGDALTITVTAVTQDEPLDGVGDGDTSPDAQRAPEPDRVLVRAERQGPGDGRVYRISFEADDGNTGMCTGTVVVAVPHDRPGAVDSGLVVDSFG